MQKKSFFIIEKLKNTESAQLFLSDKAILLEMASLSMRSLVKSGSPSFECWIKCSGKHVKELHLLLIFLKMRLSKLDAELGTFGIFCVF